MKLRNSVTGLLAAMLMFAGAQSAHAGEQKTDPILGVAPDALASFGGAEVTRLFAPPSVPLSVPGPPVGVRITPGSELEVRVAPRIRLVEGISLGAEYGWTRVGATKMVESAGNGSFETAGGSGQRVGVGLRYSTLPAFAEGRSVVPMEMELRYQRTTAGPEGAPDTGYAIFEARFLPRLWGR